MTDQLITVSGALQLCIGISRMQEHETAEGKSNSLIARQSSLIEQLMDANKKSSAKCGDVLRTGSSVLSFISMLLIVALFLRMESINRKTEMNELRISNLEKRIEVGSPQTTNHKHEMETQESK